MNKIESPSPKDALCRRRFFLISSMYFSYFIIISPWKRARALHLNKLEFPSPKDTLCQVWLKLTQWFWRKRWKCEKFTTTSTSTSITTDNGQILIRKAHLSFWCRWVKKIWSKSKFEVDRPVLDLLHSTQDFSSYILLAGVGMLILFCLGAPGRVWLPDKGDAKPVTLCMLRAPNFFIQETLRTFLKALSKTTDKMYYSPFVSIFRVFLYLYWPKWVNQCQKIPKSQTTLLFMHLCKTSLQFAYPHL